MWAPLQGLIGRKISLETMDGCTRSGKLTDITWRSVRIQGIELEWPMGLILNGDATDELPWDRLKWVVEHES